MEKDGTELTVTERKWVGHVCGQLSWLARQCRGDLLFGVSRVQQLAGVGDPAALDKLYILVERAKEVKTMRFKPLGCEPGQWLVVAASDASFGGMPRGRSQGGAVCLIANPELLEGKAMAVPVTFQSALLKRVVRSSLAAEISQAAEALDQADFLRAVMAEALYVGFDIDQWLLHVAHWRLITVLDSRTGYDLLNGSGHGEDRRLAIDIAAMKQALFEDGGNRLVRWVPGNDHVADDLTKLIGNGRLMKAVSDNEWSLRDTAEAKALREDAAQRKRKYRQRIAERRQEAEHLRQRG